MEEERQITTAAFEWRGVTVSVSYEPNWLNMRATRWDMARSHLEVRAVAPEGARLPITETGYRSYFLHPDDVTEAGGPAEYVRAWLDHAAQSPEWRRRVEAARQLTLF